MSFGDSICFSRKGRIGGEVGGYTQRVQTAWQSLDSAFRNALVDSGWAIAILLSMNGLRKQSSHLHGAHFWQGSVFPVLVSCCWLSAVTIASSLIGGCGLSHKHVEDGCKSTCVKFGG